MMIGAYVPYKKGSAQYQWLRADLAAVDRARTPWLIVVTHPPWYAPCKLLSSPDLQPA